MNIAFLAHDKKKELMVQFCTAYKSVLQKHSLYATATTGRLIADNTGLPITLLLSHKQGGHQQKAQKQRRKNFSHKTHLLQKRLGLTGGGKWGMI